MPISAGTGATGSGLEPRGRPPKARSFGSITSRPLFPGARPGFLSKATEAGCLMLEIENLLAAVAGKPILDGLSLDGEAE